VQFSGSTEGTLQSSSPTPWSTEPVGTAETISHRFQWSSESGLPHLTILVTPPCHDSIRRRVINDKVDPCVPTNPAPFDWMTTSITNGYLVTSIVNHNNKRSPERLTSAQTFSPSWNDLFGAILELRRRPTTQGPFRRSS
jgi:hypothetical protein